MSVYAFKKTSGPVQCSICQDNVRAPMQLPCDHKFCSKCISHQISRLTHLIGSREEVSIVCPYCRDFFLSSVSILKDDKKGMRGNNYETNKATMSEPTGDRKAERCQPCAEGAHYELASFWCQNCAEYFCSTCAKYHRSMKMSKHHIVKTIRDKERYEKTGAKVYETQRPYSAYSAKEATVSLKDGVRLHCEPCNQRKKTKDAKFLCENCNEKMCDECSKCHRSMKMSKTHKVVSVKEILAKQQSKYGLDMKCDKHYNETLSLFCKRCQTSCCAICAVTDHVNCGKQHVKAYLTVNVKRPKEFSKPDTKPVAPKKFFSWSGTDDVTLDVKPDSTISSEMKDKKATKESKKESEQKCTIPLKTMELRKGRIEIECGNENDWIISMTVMSNGDILILQLYDNLLKHIDSLGNLVSISSFTGHPWSVALFNDSQAVVSFSDRKQLQLVNVNRSGLEVGKKINTRHKCLAVCFARNLIAATCWEGCVHVINISGQEIGAIDRDQSGQRLFTNPEYIAADKLGTIIYVSDYKRNSITALKLLPNKIENKPLFVFTHTELLGPKGVAVDREGVVYISGMTSRNIFRLSPTGQLVQIFRRREDTDYYEDIAVSSAGDKLFVSAYQDNTIIVFRLKDTKK